MERRIVDFVSKPYARLDDENGVRPASHRLAIPNQLGDARFNSVRSSNYPLRADPSNFDRLRVLIFSRVFTPPSINVSRRLSIVDRGTRSNTVTYIITDARYRTIRVSNGNCNGWFGNIGRPFNGTTNRITVSIFFRRKLRKSCFLF